MTRSLPPTSAQRERRVLRINARYEAQVGRGFPVTLQGNAETLQVARDVDRTNWLTVKDIYEEGIAAGFGDVPDLAFLQTTSNARYTMTFNEALGIIRDLRTWGLLCWDNWNRLKGLARNAELTRTSEELEAIDLEEGWP